MQTEPIVNTIHFTLRNTTGYEFDCSIDIYESEDEVFDAHEESAIESAIKILGNYHDDESFIENCLKAPSIADRGICDGCCDYSKVMMHYLDNGKMVKSILAITGYEIPNLRRDEKFEVKR